MRTRSPPDRLRLGTWAIVLSLAVAGLIVSYEGKRLQTQPRTATVGWALGAQQPLAALSVGGPNTWTNVTSPLAPSARAFHAMAWDSRAGRVILFGGAGGPAANDTWAFDFSNDSWADMNPSVHPPARTVHAMAYDSQSDRMILFGGEGGGAGYFADTWAYDFNSNTWANKTSSNHPPARAFHAMAYDSQSDRVILFGGYAADFFADTWAYDFDTNTWANKTSSNHPPARSGYAMAYNSQSDRVILFGGLGPGEVFADTWAYDFNTNTWMNRTSPIHHSGRYDYAMAYDSQSDRVILFGGAGPLGETLADTWAYDFNMAMWTNKTSSNHPPGASYHAMAYDSQSDRVILFGGNTLGGVSADTWAYDFNTNMWTKVSPAAHPRYSHAMAYDSRADRTVLFGGTDPNNLATADTWIYNANTNTWTNVTPAMSPSARAYHAMVYDSRADRVILFGGYNTGIQNEETWSYDLTNNTWTDKTTAAPHPSARHLHAMAYDSRADRVVLFGGFSNSGADLYDVWAYDFSTNTWTEKSNFTAFPVGSEGAAMVYDVLSDRMVLFGGVSFTPVVYNETWSYDLTNTTWTKLAPPAAPPKSAQGPMVFDSRSNRSLLFGDSLNAETWAFDSNADRWTNLSPSSSPPGRSGEAIVYDSHADRVVLFGGYGTAVLDDTWLYEYFQPPSSPQSPQAFVGDRHVNLTWLAPASDGGMSVTNYRIYRGTSSGGESHLADVGNVLLYGDTGLTNGVTYYYEVSAVNAIGEGPRSAELAATPFAGGAPPTAPRSLQVTAGNANLVLSWQSPSSDGGSPVTGYRLYRGPSSGGESLLVNLGTVLTHTDTGLTNGVTYYYEVSALNPVGEGPRSNEVSAFPTPLQLSITATPHAGPAPLTVSFTSTVAGGSAPYTFVWSFGDGASSTLQNPVHQFALQGNYTVSLFASDSAGSARTGTIPVNVTPALAVIASADVVTGSVPLTVHFTGGASGGTPTYSFRWDFGDGTGSGAQNASHTYAAAGDYLANLTVTDASGHTITRGIAIKATPSVSVGPSSGFPYWILYLAVAIAAALVAFVLFWRRRKRPGLEPPPPEGPAAEPVTEAPPPETGT